MKVTTRFSNCAALLAVLAVFPLGASAQLEHRVLPSAGTRPTQLTPLVKQQRSQSGPMPNAIYGTLAALAGHTITIRTRSGRLRIIDASSAFASGTISLPLYIGKLVVAEGISRANGVLSAARISRLSRLENANADR